MATELPQEFDKARDEASFTEHRQAQIVHNSAQGDGIAFNNSGVMDGAAGAAKQVSQAQSKAKRDRKAATDTQILLASIQAAEDMAAAAGAKADGYEEGFFEQFGAEWREEIGLRVLDADEFPQKRENETQADYNLRLEDVLIEKMIDPKTGEIKDEYKNDPEKLQYAEWAKARHQEREAKVYIENKQKTNRTPEEQAQVEKFEKAPAFKQAIQAKQEASVANVQTVELDDAINTSRDDLANNPDTGDIAMQFKLGV